jgi:hypothetical protein
MGTSGALVAPWSPPSMVEGLWSLQLVLAAAASFEGMLVCMSICFGAKNLCWVSESMADSGTPPLSSEGGPGSGGGPGSSGGRSWALLGSVCHFFVDFVIVYKNF